jgi:hypothetical protein
MSGTPRIHQLGVSGVKDLSLAATAAVPILPAALSV